MEEAKIALAPFLCSCPAVVTLGIRASFDDYSSAEKDLLRHAHRVFFPTPRFLDIFQALDIPTFPRPTTYRYQRSRVLQQLLFQYAGVPHPRSHIYYGKRQKRRILEELDPPFLLMGPESLPGSTYIVDTPQLPEAFLERHNPIIACEAIEWSQRIRLICVQFECVGALRQVSARPKASPYDANTFEALPLEILSSPRSGLHELHIMTLRFLELAQLDDILIEWGYGAGTWQMIGMSRPPMHWSTPGGAENRHHHICRFIQAGLL